MQARFGAMLEERTRIARELHDTVLQGFTGLTLELGALSSDIASTSPHVAAELSRVLERADDALRDARQTVWDIRAPDLGPGDLRATLERKARDVIGSSPIDASVVVHGTARQLPPAIEIAAMRICREALTNAVRHAAPTTIVVELSYEPEQITLTVLDNGRGMDDFQLSRAASDGHWGVVGMRERAALLGGRLEVESALGRGTRVTLQLPTASVDRPA
jgi:signal transduction histidine kinase